MSEPIRILQCLPSNMGYGGIETFVMNLYRNIDTEKVQFDFLIHGEGENSFEEEIKLLGGEIYRVPSIKRYIKYHKQMKKIFLKNSQKYNAIHIHCGYAIPYFDAKIAKKYGIDNIIVHSHSSNTEFTKRKIVQILLKNKLSNLAIYRLACSEEAAKWMFSDKVIEKKQYEIVKNAIDLDKYKFNIDTREKIRKELNLEGKFVIGHIGRLAAAKNHIFLLEVFKKIYQNEKKSVLLLVGDGELKNEIKAKAKELNIIDKIIFIGKSNNVTNYLQAMDVFVFPSLYEGFGLAVLEAQVSGLQCFVSDTITKEIDVAQMVNFISLEKKPEEWANIILNSKEYKRENKSDIAKQKKYEIAELSKEMEKFYLMIKKG